MRKEILIFIILVLALSCATRPPVNNPQFTESNLPDQYSIKGVSPIEQQHGCGPASLAILFNFYGKRIGETEIAEWIQDARGTTIDDLEQFVKRQGFNVFSFTDSNKNKRKIKYFLSQNYPVLVTGQVRLEDENHATILIGYNEKTRCFVVCDPALGRIVTFPYDKFVEFHRAVGPSIRYYGLVIFPRD